MYENKWLCFSSSHGAILPKFVNKSALRINQVEYSTISWKCMAHYIKHTVFLSFTAIMHAYIYLKCEEISFKSNIPNGGGF